MAWYDIFDPVVDFFTETIPEFGSDVRDVFEGERIGQTADGGYIRDDSGVLDYLGDLFSGSSSNTPAGGGNNQGNNQGSGGLWASLTTGDGGVLGKVVTGIATGALAGLSAQEKQKLINEAARLDREHEARMKAQTLANQLLQVKLTNQAAFQREAFRNAIQAAGTGGTNTATTLTNLADIAQRPLGGR